MADSPAFVCLCEFLESETSFDRLEARGTVRLALRKAGLDARDAGSAQLVVVVEKLLEGELVARGIEDAAAVCGRAAAQLAALNEDSRSNSPAKVFQRMVGE